MSQKLVIIRGLPNSGKSTFVREVLLQGDSFDWHEADHFFLDDDGEYHFDPLKLKDAHRSCFQKTKDSLESGRNVVVSNTNSRLWEFEEYIKLAESIDIPAFVILVEGKFDSDKPIDMTRIRDLQRARWEPYAWA
jgi:predicted kinase